MRQLSNVRRAGRAPARALLLLLLLLLASSLAPLACGGGTPAGSRAADVSTGQLLIELGDAVNDVRQENALLQAQIDSLRGEVARQDTLLTRLSALAGLAR